MKVWEAAIIVLKRTDNPAVMWGDEGLLHMIAEELGWEHESWNTSRRVLDALRKTPGKLRKGLTECHRRNVLIFRLDEAAELG